MTTNNASTQAMSDEQIAMLFHDTYERLGPSFGWDTQQRCKREWADLPPENKHLMVATCKEVRALLAAQPTGARGEEVSEPTGDDIGSAEHWKEKAQDWAAEAHKLRREMLTTMVSKSQLDTAHETLSKWYSGEYSLPIPEAAIYADAERLAVTAEWSSGWEACRKFARQRTGNDYHDAYRGARDEMYTWKRRALAAEAELRGQPTGDVRNAALAALEANHEWHQTYDDYGGYPESELCTKNEAAIAALKSAQVPQPTEHPPRAGVQVTDEMVEAYLAANDQYWRETDAQPATSPSKFRNGTPAEATRVSLIAALAVSQPVQKPVACVICHETEPHTGTCGSNDKRALCNAAPLLKVEPTADAEVKS